MLHGALGSKEQFEEIEKQLDGKFKTHSINFSGHGRRPSHQHGFTIQNFAHEVLDWLNEHYDKNIDIFGYSMGGYVALWLARFYPDRVGKIFTLGTKLQWSTDIAEKEIKMLEPEIVEVKVPAFAKALAERHGEHEWKSVMAKTAYLMRDLGHAHLTDQDFIKIEHPVQLGLGDKDNMVTADETEYVKRLLKSGSFVTLPNTPHPLEKVDMKMLAGEIDKFFS